MSHTLPKHTPQECQICLENITNEFILECTHIYCRECVKGFCESQKKRDITPSCPLCMHEIKSEWLDNMMQAEDQLNQSNHPVVQDLELPIIPPSPEERKENAYFCPGCQDGEGVVDYQSRDPTKATCQCGHQFCIDCYQQWGANGDHHCARQISLRVNSLQLHPHQDVNLERGNEVIDATLQCPKCALMGATKGGTTKVFCEPCNYTFCLRCKEKYQPGHCYSPFEICGEHYTAKKDDLCIASVCYLWLDILIWPQIILLAPIFKKIGKCNDWCEVVITLFMMILVLILICLGIIISCALMIVYPCLAYKRYEFLTKKIAMQENQA